MKKRIFIFGLVLLIIFLIGCSRPDLENIQDSADELSGETTIDDGKCSKMKRVFEQVTDIKLHSTSIKSGDDYRTNVNGWECRFEKQERDITDPITKITASRQALCRMYPEVSWDEYKKAKLTSTSLITVEEASGPTIPGMTNYFYRLETVGSYEHKNALLHFQGSDGCYYRIFVSGTMSDSDKLSLLPQLQQRFAEIRGI